MFYSKRILEEKEFAVLSDALKEREPVLVKGVAEPILPFFIKNISVSQSRRILMVLPDETGAREIATALSAVFGKCFFCPAREYELINFDSTARDFGHLRVETMLALAENDFDAVITTPEALLQATVPPSEFKKSIVTLKPGDERDLGKTVSALIDAGYVRSEKVEGKGQIAVRGDILDIFPPSSEYPVRIEFFGDEIDAMGIFDVISQRRTENVFEVKIPPATEIFFSSEKTNAMLSFIDSETASSRDPSYSAFLADTKERISEKMSFARDMFLSLNYEKASLLDYFDRDTVVVIGDEKELSSEADSAKTILSETVSNLAEKKKLIPGKADSFLLSPFDDFITFASKRTTVIFDNFATDRKKISPKGIYTFGTRGVYTSFSNREMLDSDVVSSLDGGYVTAIHAPNTLVASSLEEHFRELGKRCAVIPQSSDIKPEKQVLYVVYPEKDSLLLSGGFELSDSDFRVFSDESVMQKKVKKKRRGTKDSYKEKITSFADLENGDYVVHINHGIGRFEGIEKMRSADGTVKDFVRIKYAGSDVLYVPASNLDSVSKYIGPKSDSADLRLNKMGGSEWKKATSRAKKSAKEIASKLISIYAARMNLPGFGFSPDTSWQREFEDSFPYGETPSQLVATSEIKRDMEKSVPMDRLLCGDVGFGKTEVALRGVFKCIMDNKQAAILVPTTILAWQHYQTILSRFKGYPVKAEMLSRFRTKKEQEKIIERLKKGDIDVIVGTHRLLQSDISFRDLGFLVVDEEQRFGVTHKERLKEMSRGVDVLTLTATPIPRTLNMALGGIRDMSVLEEAPEDRFPVQTFVFEYDLSVIREAVRKELGRKGQVFYLINNIDELNARAAQFAKLFPDASIAVAHGSLDRDALSDVWRDMTEKKTDILFCTTIIETGIDLPDANTLIIENADRFGLSQLHQIRGRVGRSDRKAYAFLTYRKGRCLSDISRKRLDAIREYTEFGSGFKIALRDLELRGAGNLLGAEQSGHLDSVGYDLYMQLLSDAVLEEKGEKAPKRIECTVDLPISAFLPEKYVPSEQDRIEIYRRIAASKSDSDVDELRDEMSDRFGDIPREVENLFRTVRIKWLGEEAGCTKIQFFPGRLIFRFEEPSVPALSLLPSIYASRIYLSLTGKPHIELTCGKNDSIIELCEEVLCHVSGFTKDLENE